MPMPLARAVVAMLILMILAAGASSSPSPSFISWLEMQMMESKIPGVSIAVIKDYKFEWAAGFGMSDMAHQVKLTPDTLFQAAFVSKAISAIALMIALEEHKLSVDDEVNATLAKFPPEESVGQWRLRNGFPTKVTLRMLLSHIGGINDFHYSGYRYGYYNNPPGPLEPFPTLHRELTGLPPSTREGAGLDLGLFAGGIYHHPGDIDDYLRQTIFRNHGRRGAEAVASQGEHLRSTNAERVDAEDCCSVRDGRTASARWPAGLRHGRVWRTYDHADGARGTDHRGSQGPGRNATKPDHT